MKITRQRAPVPPYRFLRDFRVGTVVNLKKRLNQDMETGNPILLVNLQSYRLYSDGHHECPPYNKVAVLNLNNNKISYIDDKREAYEIDAEVRIS